MEDKGVRRKEGGERRHHWIRGKDGGERRDPGRKDRQWRKVKEGIGKGKEMKDVGG